MYVSTAVSFGVGMWNFKTIRWKKAQFISPSHSGVPARFRSAEGNRASGRSFGEAASIGPERSQFDFQGCRPNVIRQRTGWPLGWQQRERLNNSFQGSFALKYYEHFQNMVVPNGTHLVYFWDPGLLSIWTVSTNWNLTTGSTDMGRCGALRGNVVLRFCGGSLARKPRKGKTGILYSE